MANPAVEPLSKSRPYWLLIALACLVPAILDGLKAYLQSRLLGNGVTDWGDVIFSGTEWIFLGALTPITYLLASRFPLNNNKPARVVLVHIIGALTLCVGWATLGLLLGLILHRYPAQDNLLHGYLSWLLTSLPWSVFMYFTVLGCVYAFTYYREMRERETQQARLSAQLSEAKLNALRMQLHPHFLFNTLNAITVLVRDHRFDEASRMLELLSTLLRQVLQGDRAQLTTLDQEIKFVEQYLEIELVRFPGRLQVTWAIHESARDALVPEFILQPLIENAIRHGIAKRIEKGMLTVVAMIEGDQLVLMVQDDGPGYDPITAEGVGLSNTRARLATLYGSAASLEFSRADGGGTVARMRIPFKRRNQ